MHCTVLCVVSVKNPSGWEISYFYTLYKGKSQYPSLAWYLCIESSRNSGRKSRTKFSNENDKKKKNTKFPFLGEISNFREVYRSQSTFNKIPIALESLRKLLSPVEGRLNINCKVWFWSTSKLRESWILLQNHYFKYFIIEKKFDFEVLQNRTSQSMFTPAPVTSNSLFILGLLPFK